MLLSNRKVSVFFFFFNFTLSSQILWKFESNKNKNVTESVDNVKIFATTFLIITLIIGGVVLVVINMINIRERRYEIGVLRTVGMKKSKYLGTTLTNIHRNYILKTTKH